jgi:molybdenum cofactor synthesis domain-containing protein
LEQQVEIICVGNELLIGKTLNTNATWLAKQATHLGMAVKRITVVQDIVEEISTVIKEALQRKSRFILTTGGLGPTFDDKTLEGIAKALNQKLTVNEEALRMVVEKYEAYFKKKITKEQLTPARVKMATLPEKATPLRNPVGTAPGVLINAGKTFLIAFPGVPPEMEAIFEGSVITLLKKECGAIAFFEKSMFAEGIVESTLAPLIDIVMNDNHDVYIKSHVFTKPHVGGESGKRSIELHLSTRVEDRRTAESRLEGAAKQLASLIEKNGGEVRLRDIE